MTSIWRKGVGKFRGCWNYLTDSTINETQNSLIEQKGAQKTYGHIAAVFATAKIPEAHSGGLWKEV